MTAEQLLVLAAVILLPLIKFVSSRIARRHEAARKRAPPAAVPPAAPALLSRRVVRTREHPRGFPSPTAAPLVGPHRRARLRLGSLREVRRGIVLMTILGPCRGLERRGRRS